MVVIYESEFVFLLVELVWLVTVKAPSESNSDVELKMNAEDVVLIELVMTMIEADAREIVFGGSLTQLKSLGWGIHSQWSSAQL